MGQAEKISPRFIVDEEGKKTDVVLSIKDYLELVEDLEDLAILAERRDEETVSLEDFLAERRKDGRLQD